MVDAGTSVKALEARNLGRVDWNMSSGSAGAWNVAASSADYKETTHYDKKFRKHKLFYAGDHKMWMCFRNSAIEIDTVKVSGV